MRRELAEVEAAYAAGELTAKQRDERQDELVARLLVVAIPGWRMSEHRSNGGNHAGADRSGQRCHRRRN